MKELRIEDRAEALDFATGGLRPKPSVPKRLARRDEKARVEVAAARVRLTPLEDRLTAAARHCPIHVQREGLSLAALQVSLRGRRRELSSGDAGLGLNDGGTGATLTGFRAVVD